MQSQKIDFQYLNILRYAFIPPAPFKGGGSLRLGYRAKVTHTSGDGAKCRAWYLFNKL
jgi:hypothetical protein